ncbi:heavy-metal-associated domain-containing protein [Neptunicella sp.]|uniref:heavy-metal-associated domain-containing protein n=1 Tax=Neptunicella sp. TaxID=2125986 RepID=UPI003F6912C0
MLKLKIEDMTCNHCISLVNKAIKELESTAKVEIDLPERTAVIYSEIEDQDIIMALEEAGYPAIQLK